MLLLLLLPTAECRAVRAPPAAFVRGRTTYRVGSDSNAELAQVYFSVGERGEEGFVHLVLVLRENFSS